MRSMEYTKHYKKHIMKGNPTWETLEGNIASEIKRSIK